MPPRYGLTKTSRNYGADDERPPERQPIRLVHYEYRWHDDYQGWWWTEVTDELLDL